MAHNSGNQLWQDGVAGGTPIDAASLENIENAIDGKAEFTDPRMSDARTPLAHTHPVSQISDSTATGRSIVTATDGASVRTTIGAGTSDLVLGTTAGTAAAGNDARLSNARTPIAHATEHSTTGSDPVSPASIGAASVAHTHVEGDVTGLTADLAAKANATQSINAQVGTTYTLVASDAGKLVTLNNAAAITLTVPSGVFAAGQRVDILVLGAGVVTVVAGAGATVNGTPSLVSRAQYSAASVVFLSASSAVVVGDLA